MTNNLTVYRGLEWTADSNGQIDIPYFPQSGS